MAAMGHYSYVTSGSVSRPPGRLRLFDVTVMAMRAEVSTIAFWRAVIAECLASLLHVLFGCLATLRCPGYVDAGASTLLVALCFGCTVATLVQCFHHISGCHLNPVVSLVQAVTCKVTPLRALLFALAQIGGAVAGAAILHGITTGSCQSELGTTILHFGLSPWQGAGIEILLTFLLVFCVCATLDPNRTESCNKALVIGFAVAGCHLAGYRFTGSSMNPARSLGPAFVSGKWDNHWIYWAGPTLGGLTAGLLYEFIFDPSRVKSRSQPRPSQGADEEGSLQLTDRLPSPSAPRHYYNHNHVNNLPNHTPTPTPTTTTNPLGSPRSGRRTDNNCSITTNFTPTITPNHYVPGTYGERALIDMRDFRTPSLQDDVTGTITSLRRANDVTLPIRRPVPLPTPQEGSVYGRKNNPDDVTPGLENQAYTFDSNPRRVQSPCSNSQRNVINLFDDGREIIRLNDVRVF